MYSNKLIKKYNKKNVNDKNYKMDEEEPEISGDMVSYEDNHIYFYDDVNSKSILSLIKYIKIINFNLHKMQMDTEFKYNLNNVIKFEIYLHINSYGGYITDVLAGIDAIQNSKYPITTIIEGAAASCGSLLSIVGNKRLMTKNSSMLIHQLSGGCIGTYEQMKDNLLNSKYLEDKCNQIYLKNSGKKFTKKILSEILKHDLWWDANKCKKYGLIDDII